MSSHMNLLNPSPAVSNSSSYSDTHHALILPQSTPVQNTPPRKEKIQESDSRKRSFGRKPPSLTPIVSPTTRPRLFGLFVWGVRDGGEGSVKVMPFVIEVFWSFSHSLIVFERPLGDMYIIPLGCYVIYKLPDVESVRKSDAWWVHWLMGTRTQAVWYPRRYDP